ncbi:FKBP-type peptidyl-prolyl cis-trans isomerase [Guillardia theta CCMP2712]|uniref:peptidylprolyl isomerase n=1 Tax=Guillardia theta (strain CCMP2712) TaxID=905079 RepID=L1IWK5_GUITC|nr:FKBP-type peptidyl-prolyl cis-trans isomerase [Guillardia theta CCMP2712]EKX40621.1 FKBP-type peptidyl-prolyl cis-trans isomerase [Guillardia theta CCMP2712]|eukprot:XP_005827601.1 FKBP-type peptidyl-prolyl cis-trans isomerase [Guillardia theta CCMP2712]
MRSWIAPLSVVLATMTEFSNAFTPTAVPANLRPSRTASCALRMGLDQELSRRSLIQGLSVAAAGAALPVFAAEKTSKKGSEAVIVKPGLSYVDKKKNDGILSGLTAGVNEGDFVVIDYIAYLRDGTIFDNTRKRGKPVAFQVGKKQVVPGLDQGIIGMKAGEARQIFMKSEFGYGARGVCLEDKGCLVPPNTDLVYDVTLISVGPSPI